MYVEWAEGMVELGFLTQAEVDKYCIQLDRAMYGKVDAPLRFNKMLTRQLVDVMHLEQSKVDTCHYFKKKDILRFNGWPSYHVLGT